MKTKILLIAGCSHAAGAEINGSEDSVYNRQQSFGNCLARKLGYIPINIAQLGNTNAGIARSVLNWFDSQYDPENTEVGVLVAWTESLRMEVPRPKNQKTNNSIANRSASWLDSGNEYYYNMNPGFTGHPDGSEKTMLEEYSKFMVKNELFVQIISANLILQLQYFFNANNIKYLMCNTLHMFTLPNMHLEQYIRLIDHTKYYQMLSEANAFYWHYRNLNYENKKAKFWHHNEEPHRLYAEELYKFIGESKCF